MPGITRNYGRAVMWALPAQWQVQDEQVLLLWKVQVYDEGALQVVKVGGQVGGGSGRHSQEPLHIGDHLQAWLQQLMTMKMACQLMMLKIWQRLVVYMVAGPWIWKNVEGEFDLRFVLLFQVYFIYGCQFCT
jgi:hypothetical protein